MRPYQELGPNREHMCPDPAVPGLKNRHRLSAIRQTEMTPGVIEVVVKTAEMTEGNVIEMTDVIKTRGRRMEALPGQTRSRRTEALQGHKTRDRCMEALFGHPRRVKS